MAPFGRRRACPTLLDEAGEVAEMLGAGELGLEDADGLNAIDLAVLGAALDGGAVLSELDARGGALDGGVLHGSGEENECCDHLTSREWANHSALSWRTVAAISRE
jgi:hypothetical protein